MKKVLSLDAVRGALIGLAGTGAGMGLTMLIRWAVGMPPWNPETVYTVGIFTGVIAYLIGLGSLNYWARWAVGAEPEAGHEVSGHSWRRYFNVDTNHKIIGIQYFVTALVFLPFGVALQVAGRLQLSNLYPNLLSTNAYVSVIGDHGIVMLFIVILPAFSGLMNYLVPLMIGTRDMAFPRLNAFSFWLVPPAGLLTAFALLAGGFNTGWTAYAPLSSDFEPLGMTLILIGVYIGGWSSILTAVNILATVHRMRAPGMGLFRMPVFIWSSLATVGLTLVFTQFVAMPFTMVLLERVMGMGFFRPEMGGSPLLYQYQFWFYSHPAVYVFVLLGLGIITEIVSNASRKPIYSYKAVALSSPGIAIGGSLVWVHHMFAAGIPHFLMIPFMVTTLLVAVPTGVKLFAWTATMWMGKMRLYTAFLFVLSAMIIFLIGGLNGVPLGIVPVDLYVTDTYYVVGHFHGTIFGGFLFPVFAAIYFWFPKVTGRKLSEKLGKIQWLLATIGALLMIIPTMGLGLQGMRRRVAAYSPPISEELHILTLIAALLIFIAVVIQIVNIVRSIRHGERSGPNPWDSLTLEWMTSSPPPEENFAQIPKVIAYPYGYGTENPAHAVMSLSKNKAGKK